MPQTVYHRRHHSLILVVLVALIVLVNTPLQGGFGLRTVGNDEFQKVVITGAPISYSSVIDQCNTLNTPAKGWFPAAARGSDTLTAIFQESASTDFCFIGGVPFDASGSHADYTWYKPTASSTRHVLPYDSMWCTNDSPGWIPSYIEPYYTKVNYIGTLNYIAASGTTLNSRKVTAPCVICSAYKCNIADGDAPIVRYGGVVCNGVGTITGWLPSCGCICDKKFYGPLCQYPVTPTPTLTQSLPKTATLSAPHTLSMPHTHSVTETHTQPQTATLSFPHTMSATPSSTWAFTATMSLPVTPSPGPTPTDSYVHTQSEPMSTSLSPSASDTVSGSVSVDTKSMTSLMTLSITDPTSTNSQPTPSSTATTSQTSTPSTTMTMSSSISTSDSVSTSDTATSSIAISGTYSLSLSTSPSMSVLTVSESMSETSKCGMISTMTMQQPFMCIQHPSGSEHVYTPCSEMATSPPSTTSTSGNVQTQQEIDTSTWSMGSGNPAAYTWDSTVWQGGDTLSFSFQIDQPLSLSTDLSDFGNTTRDNDVPELLDVTQWMGSTSRSAPLQLLVSTTIHFYIYDSSSSSAAATSPAPPLPSNTTTTTPPPPTTSSTSPEGDGPGDSQRVAAKRKLMTHLASYPRQRIGVLLRFGGAFEEDHANLGAALFDFQIPIGAIDCGKELIINHGRLLQATTNGTAATNASSYTAPATLTARLQLMPPEASNADLSAALDAISEALTPVSTALSLAGMMPSAILAMGVQNSISAMSDCSGFWIPINLEHTNSLYHVADLEAMAFEEFDILSSPIGLSTNIFGSAMAGWVGPEPRAQSAKVTRSEAISTVPLLGRYMRGAMIAAIILITAFSLGVLAVLLVVWRVRRAFGVDMKTARDEEEALRRLEAIEAALEHSNNGSIPPPPPLQQLSWWESEQHDLNDAAALLQLPSISLLALAILGDGISLGGTMILTLRISFMSDDQYAAVYRSLALQKGFIPDLIFGDENGRLEAPGMTPVVLDMILSIVLLSLIFGYIAHLFYITYTAPLGVVSTEEEDISTATTIPPPTLVQQDDDEEDVLTPPAGVDEDRVPLSNNHSMCSDVTSTVHASPPPPRPSRYATFKRILVYLFESVAELRPIRSTPPPLTQVQEDNDTCTPKVVDTAAAADTNVDAGKDGVEMIDIDQDDLQSTAAAEEEEEATDPLFEKGEKWMRRYGLYVGGTTWALYLPIDFTVAFVIGCLEGIATGSLNYCAIKAILSVLLLLMQLAVLLWKRPLGARFDQASTVLSMVFTIISGTLVAVDLLTKRQNPIIGVAAEAIMVSAAFTVSAQAMIGAINSVLHIQVVIRQILHSIRHRINVYKKGNARRGGGVVEIPPYPQFDDDMVGGYDNPIGGAYIVNDSMVSVVSQDLQRGDDEEEEVNEGVIWKGFLNELEEEDELRLQPPPPPPRPPGPQQHYRRGGR